MASINGGVMGGGGAPPQGKPGDWTCPSCGDLVFASRPCCRKCAHPRPEGLAGPPPRAVPAPKAGDWTCPTCGDMVFASRGACRKCGTMKQGGVDDGGIEMKPGDWVCPTPGCADRVFASRMTCRKCGATKPPAGDLSASGGIDMNTLASLYSMLVPGAEMDANTMQQLGQAAQLLGAGAANPGGLGLGDMSGLAASGLAGGLGGLMNPLDLGALGGMPPALPDLNALQMPGMPGAPLPGADLNALMQQAMGAPPPGAPQLMYDVGGSSDPPPLMYDVSAPSHSSTQLAADRPYGGRSGGVEFAPGDWTCPKCADHQFARNMSCRKCGAARPGGGSFDDGRGRSRSPRRHY